MLSDLQLNLKRLTIAASSLLGQEIPIINHDRYILEQKIIPYFVEKEEFVKVMFVGCAHYTKHYEKWFQTKEYWTMDIEPRKRIYGSKKHIVGSMSDLAHFFREKDLDLIICNGVFGWGLNDRQDVEKAFAGCYKCLRQGGVLIIGWNDVPDKKPFPLETCESLSKFQPYFFPPLSTSQYVNLADESDKHIYNFYVR
ncbi:MAG: methyltransferase domain-containing protein [Scytonema sp. PMC 1070.18]|nr:methyltransferase domain-containing protein [Scytonema sp. PMC 1070.18]